MEKNVPAERRPASAWRLLVGAAVAVLLSAAFAAACSPATDSPFGDDLTPAQRVAVAQVRDATKPFQQIAAAKAAGYTAQYPAGCAESPAGVQGFHWLNEALVDANVELLRPELLMYEPQADGSMELIGVDYVVPFDAWTSNEAPTLLGMPFMRNVPLGVWALHIWAWRPNPSGTFAMWNPNASCEHAH